MDSKRRAYIKQFIKFNFIGAATVIVGACVFILMIQLNFHYVAALVGDYTVGIVFSYFMNKKYTFQAKVSSDVVPLLKTISMYAVSFLLNYLMLAIASEVYGYHLVYSQIVIIFILAIFNFVVFKHLIFREGNGKRI